MTKKQKAMLSRIIAAFIIYITLAVTDHMEILPEWLGLWGKMALYLVPYVLIGWDIVYKAFRNIRNGQVFDENFLMTVATFGAFGVGEYSEAVAVMLFYQIGEWFQSYAVGKSRRNHRNGPGTDPDRGIQQYCVSLSAGGDERIPKIISGN